MKNILFPALLLLSCTTNAQVSLDDIRAEYEKNPNRAADKYLNKATVTAKVLVTGINYSKHYGKPEHIELYCGEDPSGGGYVEGLKYEDAIKLNNHDSVIVSGVLTRLEPLHICQAKVVKIIRSDESWRQGIYEDKNCDSCYTDIKKYQQYVIADIMNAVKARNTLINKPLVFDVVIEKFYKASKNNSVKKDYIEATVAEGGFTHTIELYDLKEINKFNIGDTIRVKGLLKEYPSSRGRSSMSQLNDYYTIRLENCAISK